MDYEKEYFNLMKAIVIVAETAESGGELKDYKVGMDALKSTAQEYLESKTE